MIDSGAREQLRAHLLNSRFEVLPVRGALDGISGLPAGTTVTVTSSTAKGMAATLDLAARARALGLHAVPHVAARLVRDRAQLADVLDRMHDSGLSEVFVVAGDAGAPAGEFPDSLALLRAMADLGRLPERIGITGYPEPHAFIPDSSTIQAMAEKSRFAHHIVSQICYDPATIADWVAAVRARGIRLPIHIGVPGVVDAARLLRISLKIGLGDSLRFLRKQRGMAKLLSSYTPEVLIDRLSAQLLDPSAALAGWHWFTFNEVVATQRFRDELADRLQERPA